MRLTRKEMAERYPNQWLGLTNVKYEDDDGVTLESADVTYTGMSSKDLLIMQIDTGCAVKAWYTDDHAMPLGMVEVMG